MTNLTYPGRHKEQKEQKEHKAGHKAEHKDGFGNVNYSNYSNYSDSSDSSDSFSTRLPAYLLSTVCLLLFCLILPAFPVTARSEKKPLRCGKKSLYLSVRSLGDKKILACQLTNASGDTIVSWKQKGSTLSKVQNRDLDQDTKHEILVESRSQNYKYISLIKADPGNNSCRVLQVPESFAKNVIAYAFSRGPWGRVELVLSQEQNAHQTFFRSATRLAKAKPVLLRLHHFRILPEKLLYTASRYKQTPLYVIHAFLEALKKRDFFHAFSFWKLEMDINIFRARVGQWENLKKAAGFQLENWHLEKFRHTRQRGWITVTGYFPGKRVLYQFFLKKQFGDWKIISIRTIQELPK